MADEERQEHRWIKIKIKGTAGFKWSICARCDLVALKNPATEKRMKKPCLGQYVKITAPKSKNQRAAENGDEN